jgi:hypothetical protein
MRLQVALRGHAALDERAPPTPIVLFASTAPAFGSQKKPMDSTTVQLR